MSNLAGVQPLMQAQSGAKRDIAAVLQGLADRVTGILNRYALAGKIPVSREPDVLRDVGNAVDSTFIGPDGRNPLKPDGSPQTPYAQALMFWGLWVQYRAVSIQSAYMQSRLSAPVANWLSQATGVIPATYDPLHLWVDPSGYRLADRIWQTGIRTRLKLDSLLAEGVRTGVPSTQLANRAEQFLLPDRALIRTNRPYGGVSGSYDALRLARSEITRAYGAATIAAGRRNPYVIGMDWKLSLSHPRIDICDDLATLDRGGRRLAPPYLLDSFPAYPAHPHCICVEIPAVTDEPATIDEQLSTLADGDQPAPYTPINADRFTSQLVTPVLFGFMVSWLQRKTLQVAQGR